LIISTPGKEKSQTVILKQDRKSNAVVEHSLYLPGVEGLSTAKAAGI
jgi:hypothetical protein